MLTLEAERSSILIADRNEQWLLRGMINCFCDIMPDGNEERIPTGLCMTRTGGTDGSI